MNIDQDEKLRTIIYSDLGQGKKCLNYILKDNKFI